MGIQLPQSFANKMKGLLGEQYGAFMASYEQPRKYGLRVNTLKLRPEEFMALSVWGGRLRPVPWAEGAYYYEESDRPGKHPHYHAGLYYIQEPSAMVPAELLGVRPGDRVLDLCAAPGGKSTQLASKLQGEGVLVANDNARERTKALAKNIELAGIRNAVVLNEEPAALADVFEGWFDRILVDAPCSGEGMFRKDDSMIAEWERHSVERCSVMQRGILRHAARMLAPGGTLVYSTCTFSPEENEQQIASLLAEHADLEVAAVPLAHGWAPGRPEWTEPPEPSVVGTVRLWPHLTGGEGHYAAVLRKRGSADADEPLRNGREERVGKGRGEDEYGRNAEYGGKAADADAPGEQRRSRERKERGGGQLFEPAAVWRGNGRGDSNERMKRIAQDERGERTRREAPEDRSGRTKRGEPEGRSGRMQRGGAADGRGEWRSRKSGDTSAADAVAAWRRFAAEQLVGAQGWNGVPIAFGSRVYLQPEGLPPLDGLRVVRAGWYVGDAGPHRFEPSQPLAMGLRPDEARWSLRLRSEDEAAMRYLRGETLIVEPERLVPAAESGAEAGARPAATGYALVCADGFPIGWGKLGGDNLLKNGLPPGWRWM